MKPNHTTKQPPEVVRKRMRAVRVRGTEPERVVGKILSQLGIHYRKNAASLPGRPDFSNKKRRWAVFVHGCFWHGHDCRPGLLPVTNRGFWAEKIGHNQHRDQRVRLELEKMGFLVVTVWECETQQPSKLAEHLDALLCARSTPKS